MHKTSDFPCNYRHLGYTIEPLSLRMGSCVGWVYWNIFRPDDSHVCYAKSLREAREIIQEDKAELLAALTPA